MNPDHSKITRRRFLNSSAAATAATTISIVPRHVLGGPKHHAPSDTITYATVGNGRKRDGGIGCLGKRKKIAVCDVDTKQLGGEPDNQMRYKDFRRLLERKDLDAVCVSTPPHWHALICIAAAQAGKQIFCEKPMTKFIAEGRAVVNAVKKHGVVFQIGTFKRLDNCRNKGHIENHKIVKHGLLKDFTGTVAFAVGDMRLGKTNLKAQPVPAGLDYDLWLGPAPYKPYNAARVHYNNRFYWDYEGGDLANIGAHQVDPFQWTFAKDDTGPVEVEPYAPWPPHPDAVGPWGWVELRYADDVKLVILSGGSVARTGRWGKKYSRPVKREMLSASDLDAEGRQKLAQLPDPKRLVSFGEAIRTRKQAGGGAESSHRATTLLHLANIAIRVGRTIRWDPVTEQLVGDEEANRFVNIPMRAPWHL